MKFNLHLLPITLLMPFAGGCGSTPNDLETHNSDFSIIKHKNELTSSFENDAYSKSYSYYRILNKDTLDFVICAFESKNDSTIHLSVHHKTPMSFENLLRYIDECVPSILEDFELSKLNYLVIESPIHYLDITKELSDEYEARYGRTPVDQKKLNEFLLHSTLNKRIDSFFNSFNKQVRAYSIEKFRLLDKKYFHNYLAEKDLKDYPEFSIDGMAVCIYLQTSY